MAAFDSSSDQVGSTIAQLVVKPMSDLAETVIDLGVEIGIVAVPATEAQRVVDQLVETEIKGILNYAPIAPAVPMRIVMRNIDPVLSLQSMTFYLREIADRGS